MTTFNDVFEQLEKDLCSTLLFCKKDAEQEIEGVTSKPSPSQFMDALELSLDVEAQTTFLNAESKLAEFIQENFRPLQENIYQNSSIPNHEINELINEVENLNLSSNPDPEKINRLREKFKNMIQRSRDLGNNVAADNLQHFIDGSGSVRDIEVSWLRGFSKIQNAENRVLGYVENNNLSDWLPTINNNTTANKSDFWDAVIKSYNTFSELSYASGGSKIKANVVFQFSRKENLITVTGKVVMNWSDTYDWHEGLGFYIPGTGYVSDEDALYLQKYDGARPFEMKAQWTYHFSGVYDVKARGWKNAEWKFQGRKYQFDSDLDFSEDKQSR